MKFASPLRYPGGKSAMVALLSQIRKLNGLGAHAVAEPFAGGAGASLKMLFIEETPDIYINDIDHAIHSFWWSVVNRTQQFIEMLTKTHISMAEWRHQREVYRQQQNVSRLRLGFAAFYLNRCNRSGIIVNGGPIGGVEQTGKWKLAVRYNKSELLRRCLKVAEYRDRIHVTGLDGLKFIESADPNTTLLFIDPPYFVKGEMLYLNSLSEEYHASLAARLRSMKEATWVLTYDDCPQIRRMYRDWATIKPFSLKYATSRRRIGNELLIVPRGIRLPATQPSAALKW